MYNLISNQMNLLKKLRLDRCDPYDEIHDAIKRNKFNSTFLNILSKYTSTDRLKLIENFNNIPDLFDYVLSYLHERDKMILCCCDKTTRQTILNSPYVPIVYSMTERTFLENFRNKNTFPVYFHNKDIFGELITLDMLFRCCQCHGTCNKKCKSCILLKEYKHRAQCAEKEIIVNYEKRNRPLMWERILHRMIMSSFIANFDNDRFIAIRCSSSWDLIRSPRQKLESTKYKYKKLRDNKPMKKYIEETTEKIVSRKISNHKLFKTQHTRVEKSYNNFSMNKQTRFMKRHR
jgi:hypothetical protein